MNIDINTKTQVATHVAAMLADTTWTFHKAHFRRTDSKTLHLDSHAILLHT